jgi:hypothetical protein
MTFWTAGVAIATLPNSSARRTRRISQPDLLLFVLRERFCGSTRNKDANLHADFSAPSAASNRTTEMADRDKRASSPKSLLKRAVSGSESKDLDRQHPANSRAFPDPSEDPGGKSLHPQTRGRTERDSNFHFGFAGNRETRTRTCMPIFSRHPQHQTEPPKWPTETNAPTGSNRP